MSLNPKAFALACGILWGGGIALLALLSMVVDYGTAMVDLTATVYWGLGPSVPGMIAGFAWGFVDGWVGGWLLATLYNHFLQKR